MSLRQRRFRNEISEFESIQLGLERRDGAISLKNTQETGKAREQG
jgi:hypothetical protein